MPVGDDWLFFPGAVLIEYAVALIFLVARFRPGFGGVFALTLACLVTLGAGGVAIVSLPIWLIAGARSVVTHFIKLFALASALNLLVVILAVLHIRAIRRTLKGLDVIIGVLGPFVLYALTAFGVELISIWRE